MSLADWERNGWIRPLETSRREIHGIFQLVDRDITDASSESISNDSRFTIAYRAILNLCLIPLRCRGYRVAKGQSHHQRTIESIVLTLGEEYRDRMDYYNDTRSSRNIIDYDTAWTISLTSAEEIIEEARRLREDVRKWVSTHHPDLLPN
jgi:hypothetical protein